MTQNSDATFQNQSPEASVSVAALDSENTPLHALETAAANAVTIVSHEAFKGSAESDELEIARWAASVRLAFGRNREQFNFAICDALATAGVTPTAASVLRVGKWGHHTSVASDVSDWLSHLTQRFVDMQAGVPLPARRLANDLIEKLFTLSQVEAEKTANLQLAPLEEKLQALTAVFEAEQEKLDAARVQIQAGEKQQHLTQAELNDAVAAAAKAGLAAQVERHQLQAVVMQLEKDLASEREKAAASALKNAQAVSDLQSSALAAQQTAAEARHRLRDEADAESRRLMLQLDDQRTAERQTVAKLRTEIADLFAKLDELRQHQQSTNIAQAREAALHESALLSWNKDRLQLERQNSQLDSPDAKNANVLTLFMIYPRLGITIIRSADVDVATMLVRDLGMTAAMAEKVLLNIPQVEMAAKEASNLNE